MQVVNVLELVFHKVPWRRTKITRGRQKLQIGKEQDPATPPSPTNVVFQYAHTKAHYKYICYNNTAASTRTISHALLYTTTMDCIM